MRDRFDKAYLGIPTIKIKSLRRYGHVLSLVRWFKKSVNVYATTQNEMTQQKRIERNGNRQTREGVVRVME